MLDQSERDKIQTGPIRKIKGYAAPIRNGQWTYAGDQAEPVRGRQT